MQIDRLIGILSILLQKEQATAPELAALFEVSRRTILRDVDTLARAGIPIRTSQGVGGGIAIMDNYRVDRALLTGADMQAILTGLRSLDSVSGTRRYAQLMEKLSPGASGFLPGDAHMLIDLASWWGGALVDKIQRIHDAIDAHRQVTFQYHAPGGESRRTVEPCALVFEWGGWYLWGWCTLRQDFRLFKLNRMTALETGESFSPRPYPLPDTGDERAFPENVRIKMRVSAKYAWRLIEEYGAGCYTVDSAGDCLFSAGFASREQAIGWVLSFQGRAELLEPADLRDEIRKIGKKIVKRHKDDE